MDRRKEGVKLLGEMMSPEIAAHVDALSKSNAFGQFMGAMTLDHVYGEIWSRPGLDKRARSLVNLGMLIGLRATEELEVHMSIALKNGVTPAEIEEIVYQATAYAGFPAANNARATAVKVLEREGKRPTG